MDREYFIRGDNVDLRKVLGVDSVGSEVDETWVGYNETPSDWVRVRLHDERGSTQEVSKMCLKRNGDSVIVGQAVFLSDHAFAALRRKLRKLIKCTSAGHVSVGGLMFDWWQI